MSQHIEDAVLLMPEPDSPVNRPGISSGLTCPGAPVKKEKDCSNSENSTGGNNPIDDDDDDDDEIARIVQYCGGGRSDNSQPYYSPVISRKLHPRGGNGTRISDISCHDETRTITRGSNSYAHRNENDETWNWMASYFAHDEPRDRSSIERDDETLAARSRYQPRRLFVDNHYNNNTANMQRSISMESLPQS